MKAPSQGERNQHFVDLLRLRRRQGGETPVIAEQREDAREMILSDPPNLSQWFRAEIPAETAIPSVSPPPRIAPHQRVLVASATTGPAQARIEISGGALAGSQIHMIVAGNRLEAQLLTGNEASRQTLVTAMDAVRERLRARGLIVGGTASGSFSSSDDSQQQSRRQGARDSASARSSTDVTRSSFHTSLSETDGGSGAKGRLD